MADWLSPEEWQAVALSLRVAVWSTLLSLPFGIAIAYALARGRFPGKQLLNGLVHLPLILPGPARFRVGNTTRDWKMGQAWVFDDTIEHEAWNDADELRVILIFDIWNPWLSDAEKTLITAMMQAQRSFMTGS